MYREYLVPFFFQLKLQLAYKTPNHVHRQKGVANQIHAARLPLALVIPNSPFLLLFAFFSFFPFAFFGFSSPSFSSFSSASYLFLSLYLPSILSPSSSSSTPNSLHTIYIYLLSANNQRLYTTERPVDTLRSTTTAASSSPPPTTAAATTILPLLQPYLITPVDLPLSPLWRPNRLSWVALTSNPLSKKLYVETKFIAHVTHSTISLFHRFLFVRFLLTNVNCL